jgi:methylaspartate mutase epsilon subunit
VSKPGSFGRFVADAALMGDLVVQPRMGFADPATMRRGLAKVRSAAATTVGTLTVDSYTRVGDSAGARRALLAGAPLNGYPIVAHGGKVTRDVLAGLHDASFPVQVRHGSAKPAAIITALLDAGIDATEGGPVSYCLPYSRLPLREAVRHWARSCEEIAAADAHLESFGGCMLGQLCPPGMLVAISVLEAMFFAEHGVRSLSLSYAQQTHPEQDAEAIGAMRRLAAELLPDIEQHVVVYAYMGVYPATLGGSERLLAAATMLAVRSGAARLIVKTAAEARRIPTIAENIDALELAGKVALGTTLEGPRAVPSTGIYEEARALVDAVLNIGATVTGALAPAFERGILDIPYCLHPDNAGRTRSYIDDTGRLRWARTGALPIPAPRRERDRLAVSSADLLDALQHVQRRFDRPPPGAEESGAAQGELL